jgi:hypothetical protein
MPIKPRDIKSGVLANKMTVEATRSQVGVMNILTVMGETALKAENTIKSLAKEFLVTKGLAGGLKRVINTDYGEKMFKSVIMRNLESILKSPEDRNHIMRELENHIKTLKASGASGRAVLVSSLRKLSMLLSQHGLSPKERAFIINRIREHLAHHIIITDNAVYDPISGKLFTRQGKEVEVDIASASGDRAMKTFDVLRAHGIISNEKDYYNIKMGVLAYKAVMEAKDPKDAEVVFQKLYAETLRKDPIFSRAHPVVAYETLMKLYGRGMAVLQLDSVATKVPVQMVVMTSRALARALQSLPIVGSMAVISTEMSGVTAEIGESIKNEVRAHSYLYQSIPHPLLLQQRMAQMEGQVQQNA